MWRRVSFVKIDFGGTYATCFSETSVFTRPTLCHNPGDGVLHSHRLETSNTSKSILYLIYYTVNFLKMFTVFFKPFLVTWFCCRFKLLLISLGLGLIFFSSIQLLHFNTRYGNHYTSCKEAVKNRPVSIWLYVFRYFQECLRHCAISQKIACSNPDKALGCLFDLPNSTSRTVAFRFTQPLTELSTRNFPGE
jgi:hypothetical protein